MTDKHLLITGRPGSGKSELLIAYANMHPKTTLFLSDESTEEFLKQQRGLDAQLKVIDSKDFDTSILNGYETLCVDYLELLSEDMIQKLLKILEDNNHRVILTSQVKRGTNELLERIDNAINHRKNS